MLFQAFGANGFAQQFALALQQALVGLEVQQTLVVLVMVVAGACGQLEQRLAAVLAAARQQRALFVNFFQTLPENALAALQQRDDLPQHLAFDQLFLL